VRAHVAGAWAWAPSSLRHSAPRPCARARSAARTAAPAPPPCHRHPPSASVSACGSWKVKPPMGGPPTTPGIGAPPGSAHGGRPMRFTAGGGSESGSAAAGPPPPPPASAPSGTRQMGHSRDRRGSPAAAAPPPLGGAPPRPAPPRAALPRAAPPPPAALPDAPATVCGRGGFGGALACGGRAGGPGAARARCGAGATAGRARAAGACGADQQAAPRPARAPPRSGRLGGAAGTHLRAGRARHRPAAAPRGPRRLGSWAWARQGRHGAGIGRVQGLGLCVAGGGEGWRRGPGAAALAAAWRARGQHGRPRASRGGGRAREGAGPVWLAGLKRRAGGRAARCMPRARGDWARRRSPGGRTDGGPLPVRHAGCSCAGRCSHRRGARARRGPEERPQAVRHRGGPFWGGVRGVRVEGRARVPVDLAGVGRWWVLAAAGGLVGRPAQRPPAERRPRARPRGARAAPAPGARRRPPGAWAGVRTHTHRGLARGLRGAVPATAARRRSVLTLL
jgi:hypothetical protein